MEDNKVREQNKPAPSQGAPDPPQPINPEKTVPEVPLPALNLPPAQIYTKDPAVHQAKSQDHISTEDKKRVGPSEGWMIVLTGIIAIATGLNVWIFYMESESTGKQIDKLTEKAGGIVDSMNTALSNNRDAIIAVLEASRKQSDASLKVSRDISRLDQRAWVGLKGSTGKVPFQSQPSISVNQPYTVGVIVYNSGKTPAMHWKGITDTVVLPRGVPFSPRYRPQKDDIYETGEVPMAPGGQLAMMARQSDDIMTQPEIDKLKARSSILYVFGSYTYSDISGVPHFLKVCMFLTDDLVNTASCKTYNDAN